MAPGPRSRHPRPPVPGPYDLRPVPPSHPPHPAADTPLPPGDPPIDDALRRDQPALRRLWKNVQQAHRAGQPFDRNLQRLFELLDSSRQKRADRAAAAPAVTYPADLPISQKREDIAQLIRDHQVVVVCGETGSGKSTQLPKILMELGYGNDGVIAHTQPRRIAARTLASRVADELNVPLGQAVGYSVRFNDTTGDNTRVRYLTDGLLLAELGRDPDLLKCDAVIVDEAHERSLNVDFLLGYLKRLRPRRPDLKIIITSATIDPQRFAAFFSTGVAGREDEPAPIIEVSGRTYPVDVRYCPVENEQGEEVEFEGYAADHALCEAFDQVTRDPLGGAGDVLVFMPTERAIGHAAKTLRSHTASSRSRQPDILPLYSRLSSAEQQKVFNPKSGGPRRVVIATNVAESSVTVPNITAVIDPGTARISRYSPRTRMQRLPVEAVSQASANQRAGRCGRVAPGVCIRLCSEQVFEERDPFTTPEILRTSLAAVMLQMASLNLGDLGDFPFLDPPRPSAVREGTQTLEELGAIGPSGRLTKTGKTLARLPVDPRVGRMVLAGAEQRCLPEVLIIAAALEGQDPRVRPPDHAQAADSAHAPMRHESSDFLTYLTLWDAVHAKKSELSGSAFKRWATKNFLGYQRLREWFDLHRQLTDLARTAKLSAPKRVTGENAIEKIGDAVHRALLTGLLSNIALKTDTEEGRKAKGEYTGAGSTKLALWPGSVLFKAKPRWIVAAETVATTRQYARTLAKIDPAWIEPLAGDLVKTNHFEPHWNPKSGTANAFEKATLFGLVIAAKRRIRLAKVDPKAARELFIHHALVEGECESPGLLNQPFFAHNRELQNKVEQVQARERRNDLLADITRRFDFYDRHLPADVVGVAELNRWLKQADDATQQRLLMQESDLLTQAVEADPGRPDHLAVAAMKLPLVYKHDPGATDDGVTLQIPLHALGRLTPATLEWGLPGQLHERLVALIRSLPKETRRALGPAPQASERAAERLTFGEGHFADAAADALGWVAGVPIDANQFNLARLEDHQRLNVAVLDDAGEVIEQSRDLPALQRKLGTQATQAVSELNDPRWTQDGLTAWTFGDLPTEVEATANGVTLTAHPTLIDNGPAANTVNLRTVASRERAETELPLGVLRLATIAAAPRAKVAVDRLAHLQSTLLRFSSFAGPQGLKKQLAQAALRDVYTQPAHDYPPRSAAAFDALIAAGHADLPAAAQKAHREIDAALQHAQPLRLLVDGLNSKCPPAWEAAHHQTAVQLDTLLAEGFVARTPAAVRPHLSRYLAASRLRFKKLDEGKADRDQKLAHQFESRWRPYRDAAADHAQRAVHNPELDAYRWMLEEWRVSLFAESLGTAQPVSEKRLDRQWKKALR